MVTAGNLFEILQYSKFLQLSRRSWLKGKVFYTFSLNFREQFPMGFSHGLNICFLDAIDDKKISFILFFTWLITSYCLYKEMKQIAVLTKYILQIVD